VSWDAALPRPDGKMVDGFFQLSDGFFQLSLVTRELKKSIFASGSLYENSEGRAKPFMNMNCFFW
jgi:hypothetical protein